MFDHTIDGKPFITDNNGNEIIDLAKSIFSEYASAITSYRTVKTDEAHLMRPDKVAFDVYGKDNLAEMILKYSGISNPFSLDKTDILMLPEYEQIYSLLATDEEETEENNTSEKIKNYFKFSNTYKSDLTSYNELENKTISSGVKTAENTDYTVPYISDDGNTAVTIRNGRMYFGEDAGLTTTTNLDEKILSLIDSTASAIADQCALNGLSLTDFVRASTKNS